MRTYNFNTACLLLGLRDPQDLYWLIQRYGKYLPCICNYDWPPASRFTEAQLAKVKDRLERYHQFWHLRMRTGENAVQFQRRLSLALSSEKQFRRFRGACHD